jgi:hypothetical protein
MTFNFQFKNINCRIEHFLQISSSIASLDRVVNRVDRVVLRQIASSIASIASFCVKSRRWIASLDRVVNRVAGLPRWIASSIAPNRVDRVISRVERVAVSALQFSKPAVQPVFVRSGRFLPF